MLSFRFRALFRRLAIVVVAVGICVAYTSCGDDEPKSIGPSEAAVQYVRMLYDGHYAEAVSHTAGYDSTATDYNERMMQLYKQMSDEANKQFGHLADVKTIRVDRDKQQPYADVYLRLTYDNNASRDILLQLVLVKGVWFLK